MQALARQAPACTSSRCSNASSSSRRPSVVVRAQEAFCRDKVSSPKAPFNSEGKVHKLTFMGTGDEKMVVDCPDGERTRAANGLLHLHQRMGLDAGCGCARARPLRSSGS